MAAPTTEALAAIEARLQQVLDPYRDRLELATIYGNPALRKAGANAHDWFAFVKPQAKHVGFYLLPIHTGEALRASIPPALRQRLTGRSAFTFTDTNESVLAELEALVARAFTVYLTS